MATASTYCSRNWLFTIASRKLREPRFWVYQLGRGSEPVIVVGSMISLVARSMAGISRAFCPWPQSMSAARHLETFFVISCAGDGQKDNRCPLKLGSFHAVPKSLL